MFVFSFCFLLVRDIFKLRKFFLILIIYVDFEIIERFEIFFKYKKIINREGIICLRLFIIVFYVVLKFFLLNIIIILFCMIKSFRYFFGLFCMGIV